MIYEQHLFFTIIYQPIFCIWLLLTLNEQSKLYQDLGIDILSECC